MPRAPTQPAAPSPPLTVRQAAELLAVSPTVVYEACRAGRLVHFCFGRKCIRIYPDDLEAFRVSCMTGAPPPEPAPAPTPHRRGRTLADDQLGEPLPKSLTRHMSPNWRQRFSLPARTE